MPVRSAGSDSISAMGGSPARPSRHTGCDAARVVAVVMLVGFHAIPGDLPVTAGWSAPTILATLRLALFAGIPMLFAVSGYVSGVASPPRDNRHVWRRVGRLVRLLVVWSIVYGIVAVALEPVQLLHPFAYVRFWVTGLPFGIAFGHLWYLAALAECHVIDGALRAVGVGARGQTLMGVGLLAVSLTVAHFVPSLRIWLDRTAVSWYVFYAVGGVLISRARVIPRRWVIAGTVIVATGCLLLYYAMNVASLGAPDVALCTVGVTALLGLSLVVAIAGGAGWRHGLTDSRQTLGVYLFHPMALALGAAALASVAPDPLALTAIRFVWALAVGYLAAWLVSRSRHLAAVFL